MIKKLEHDFLSFRVLDELLAEKKEHPKDFVMLFEKKKAIISQIQKMELTAKVYREKL